jgi:hypothetical protein
MKGVGTTADGPIASNRVQISINPQKSFASRWRKQIAGLVKRASQHFNYGPSKPHASVMPTGSYETLATQSRATVANDRAEAAGAFFPGRAVAP